MTAPILGPAYPALLAPGLVLAGGDIVATEPDSAGRCWVILTSRADGPGVPDDCYPTAYVAPGAIDYADPHTRDRVCRALAAHCGASVADTSVDDAALTLWASWDWADGGHPTRAHALRAVADAVWGPR